jgi:drug/metabolite transporter (DMT)-like permease
VALLSPTSSAVVWNIAQRHQTTANQDHVTSKGATDLIPTIMLGAVMSALITLPFSLPLTMDFHDVSLLAGLGFVQLALPCVLCLMASRVLKAPEVALLALLEILFGIAWAWIFVGEVPTWQMLVGGALVLTALLSNVLLGWRESDESAQ